jgi:hypothetical protein
VVSKIGGSWWSFFNESYCGSNDITSSSASDKGAALGRSVAVADTTACAWRVVQVQKVVSNSCLLDRVFNQVEAYPPTKPCFANCTAPKKALAQHGNMTTIAPRNMSDPCWVTCAYTAVLGPEGGQPNGTITGMPLTGAKCK